MGKEQNSILGSGSTSKIFLIIPWILWDFVDCRRVIMCHLELPSRNTNFYLDLLRTEKNGLAGNCLRTLQQRDLDGTWVTLLGGSNPRCFLFETIPKKPTRRQRPLLSPPGQRFCKTWMMLSRSVTVWVLTCNQGWRGHPRSQPQSFLAPVLFGP